MLCREAVLPGEDAEPDADIEELDWAKDLSAVVKRRLQIINEMKELIAPKVMQNVERAQELQKRNYDNRHNLQKVIYTK